MSRRHKSHGASSREKELLAIIARLEARIAELEAQLAKARKNSSTSSKPPSSDIVKPPKPPIPKGAAKRKKGGQPGHPKHERPPFSPEDIDATHEYTMSVCPDCGGTLKPSEQTPRVVQQVELTDKPVRIDEHRGLAYWCEACQKVHYAPLPPEVEKGGLVGPGLTAHIAYLKGVSHASFSTIRKYVRDVLGITISRGQLSKIIQKVSRALEGPYERLIEALSGEAHLNVDETGHKENGARFWTWCFRAQDYTVFKIVQSRSSEILFDLLGEEFAGVLGCDYFSAYRKYMKDCDIRVQFCLAHLIRELRYLTTLASKQTQAYGEALLEYMRELFHIIHRRHKMGENAFAKALCDKRRAIIGYAINHAPQTRAAQCLARRFEKHGAAYFQFITTPGIGPTNNLAEQAIRFVVIDRRITQGTRSEKGRQWCERIWTTLATCAAQGRSAHAFLRDVVQAHFRGQPVPSLLFDSS